MDTPYSRALKFGDFLNERRKEKFEIENNRQIFLARLLGVEISGQEKEGIPLEEMKKVFGKDYEDWDID